MSQTRRNISKEINKSVYTDMDAYETYGTTRTGLTASKWNSIDTTFGAISVSQGTKSDELSVLDSDGTSVAGDVLGQLFIAPEVWPDEVGGMSNIHHFDIWGKVDITTDNLRFSLCAPSAYTSAGVPTFTFADATQYYLDVTNATEAKAGTLYRYVQLAGTEFSAVDTVQRLNVPLRYASHRTAMTTLDGAVLATDTAIEVFNNANAIDNHNNISGSGAKGEMVVVRKLSTGKEYRYMIGSVVGNLITIVPNVYDASGSTVGIAFDDGDEVFFPLTAGNTYCIFWYLSKAGAGPVSTFTFYGRNNYPTYPDITNYIGTQGDGNLLWSTTGYTHLARVGSNYNSFFEVYSTPNEWAIDNITIDAQDSNLLTGMEFEVVRATNMFREETMLVDRFKAGYNGASIEIPLIKSNLSPKMNWGDFLRIQAKMNTATSLGITYGVTYRTFFQNDELYVAK